MRTTAFVLFTLASMIAMDEAFAQQDVLYRCETAEGISIQGVPCPKGATQRKIAVQRTTLPATPSAPNALAPAVTAPASTTTPTPAPAPPKPTAAIAAPTAAVTSLAPPPAPRPGTHWVLVTDDALMHGPSQPYPLWQCMRADGSTYDSRDGVAGKQWAPTPKPEDADDTAPVPPPKDAALRKGPIVRHMGLTTSVVDDTPKRDLGPPPPGAPPGQWVADACTKLEPQQACARFAARRDALRRQIYAARPSERASYAPEEQDLTTMLYAACGM